MDYYISWRRLSRVIFFGANFLKFLLQLRTVSRKAKRCHWIPQRLSIVISSTACRLPWIVSAAPWDAWRRFGIRASPGWLLGQTAHYRRTQSRSTLKDLSVCRWTPWRREQLRTAEMLWPDRCRWTLGVDDRWTGCIHLDLVKKTS